MKSNVKKSGRRIATNRIATKQNRAVGVLGALVAASVFGLVDGSIHGFGLPTIAGIVACLTTTPLGAALAAVWTVAYCAFLPYLAGLYDPQGILAIGMAVGLGCSEIGRLRARGAKTPLPILQAAGLVIALLLVTLRAYPLGLGGAWTILYLLRIVSLRLRKSDVAAALPNALLATFSVILAVAVAELTASYALGWRFAGGDMFVAHPTTFVTHNPGGKGTFVIKMPGDAGSLVLPASISSQGLRDREYGPKRPDEFRVLLLGDSFVEGHGVELDATIGRRLEAFLAKMPTKKTVTVMNGGVGMFAPWQEQIFLQEKCLALEPDLVIQEIFPCNDVEGMLDREGQCFQSTGLARQRTLWAFKRWAEPAMRADLWLQHSSALYAQWLRYTKGDSRLADALHCTRFFEEEKPPKLPESDRDPYVEHLLVEEYPVLSHAWDACLTTLGDTRELCASKGIDYAVFAIPMLVQVDDEWWDGLVKRAPNGVTYERWKDQRLIKAYCERSGISFIDIIPTLREGGPPKSVYYELDGHFQPLGCYITATTLGDWMIQEYFPRADLLRSSPPSTSEAGQGMLRAVSSEQSG